MPDINDPLSYGSFADYQQAVSQQYGGAGGDATAGLNAMARGAEAFQNRAPAPSPASAAANAGPQPLGVQSTTYGQQGPRDSTFLSGPLGAYDSGGLADIFSTGLRGAGGDATALIQQLQAALSGRVDPSAQLFSGGGGAGVLNPTYGVSGGIMSPEDLFYNPFIHGPRKTGYGQFGNAPAGTPQGNQQFLNQVTMDTYNRLGIAPTFSSTGTESATRPRTFSVEEGIGGTGFGFDVGAGVPGGNAVDFLTEQGFPVPDFLNALNDRDPFQTGDLAASAQQLGGIELPSLQSLSRLSPSELDFLSGFFESLLGIPFADILFAAQQPTRGLRQGAPARTGGLGLFG